MITDFFKLRGLEENELLVIIPASFATGESGEPLSEEIKYIILAMQSIGYVPSCFGESNDSSQELWFQWEANVLMREIMVNEFINSGGME